MNTPLKYSRTNYLNVRYSMYVPISEKESHYYYNTIVFKNYYVKCIISNVLFKMDYLHKDENKANKDD